MDYWGLSDIGKVRAQNQDSFRIEELDRHTVLAVVCDGMGGAKSGNIASRLATDVFTDEVVRSYKPGMSQEQTEQLLVGAVKLANFTVYDQARQFEEFAGMGTTLVAALVSGRTATVVNVGDSRCYHITREGFRRIIWTRLSGKELHHPGRGHGAHRGDRCVCHRGGAGRRPAAQLRRPAQRGGRSGDPLRGGPRRES